MFGQSRFADEFVKHGCSWVGGCCGCGPEGIEDIGLCCLANLDDEEDSPLSKDKKVKWTAKSLLSPVSQAKKITTLPGVSK